MDEIPEMIVEEGVVKPKPDGDWRHPEWFEDAAVPTGSLLPEPGTVCPTCHEKTPTRGALYMRKWRARKKE